MGRIINNGRASITSSDSYLLGLTLNVIYKRWNKLLDELIQIYSERAVGAENAYKSIRGFLGDSAPSTLKGLLQDAGDNGNSVLPDDVSPYFKRGILINREFAQKRLEEGKEFAAGGILDETDYAIQVFNYICGTVTPKALNDGRIHIDFSEKDKKRVLNIKDFVLTKGETQEIEKLTRAAIQKGAKNISGTSGMKKLKTLSKISPAISVFDIGGEKGPIDILVKLGLDFYYGEQHKTGVFDSITIQNKYTDAYKEKPYYKIFEPQNVIEFKDVIPVIKNATNKIDFFRLNGKVYYTYEILTVIKKEMNDYIKKNDLDGLSKFLGGK